MKFLNEHHSTRKLLKQALIAGCMAVLTLLVNNQATILADTPAAYSGMMVTLFAVANAALNWKKHNM